MLLMIISVLFLLIVFLCFVLDLFDRLQVCFFNRREVLYSEFLILALGFFYCL